MAKLVALLRAVNVGGRKLPMAELSALCEGLGWSEIRTYIQSGNLVFEADAAPAALEAQLEKALSARFGFEVPVVIRTSPQWKALVASNPFAKESETEANWVLAGLSKAKLDPGAAAAIQAKAASGERVVQAGEALWFHYPAGVGTSKLTPALIDRAAGSAVTARNWRTIIMLNEMLN